MKKLLVLPLVALLAACSGGAKSSSLSLSARAGSVAATTTTTPPTTGVSLTRIRVALRDLELRSRLILTWQATLALNQIAVHQIITRQERIRIRQSHPVPKFMHHRQARRGRQLGLPQRHARHPRHERVLDVAAVAPVAQHARDGEVG